MTVTKIETFDDAMKAMDEHPLLAALEHERLDAITKALSHLGTNDELTDRYTKHAEKMKQAIKSYMKTHNIAVVK